MSVPERKEAVSLGEKKKFPSFKFLDKSYFVYHILGTLTSKKNRHTLDSFIENFLKVKCDSCRHFWENWTHTIEGQWRCP